MSGLGARVDVVRRERFVGRDAELATLTTWLGPDGATTPIVNVTGPGGIGKSWLLERLGDLAVAQGWAVVAADGHSIVTRADLFEALSGSRQPAAARRFLAAQDALLVVVDTFEVMEGLSGALQGALRELAEPARVVIAGRRRLSGSWRSWSHLVRHLEVRGLSTVEQHDYLTRRGVLDRAKIVEVAGRSGGHPLTMSLAADLLVNHGVSDLGSSAQWAAAVSRAVAGLRGGAEAPVADLLEAAAVLGRFDRSALLAVVGRADAGPWFAELVALSGVSRAGGEFELHDDLRYALNEDLRLNRPDRLEQLRSRGLRHYHQLEAAAGPGGEARRLAERRLLMVGRGLVDMAVYFAAEDSGLRVEDADTGDFDELALLQTRFPEPICPAPEERDPSLLRALLRDPAAVVRVARDGSGAALGYAFRFEVSAGTAELARYGPGVGGVIEAALEVLGAAALPTPSSNLFYWSTVCAPVDTPAVYAELGRDIWPQFLTEGAWVTLTADPVYVQSITTAGFAPLDFTWPVGDVTLRAYLLDLSRVGFSAWVRSLATRSAPPRLPLGAELTQLAVRAVSSWADDRVLGEGGLAAIAEPDPDTTLAQRADAVRDLLRRSLGSPRPWPSLERRLGEALADAHVTALPSGHPSAPGERRRHPRPLPPPGGGRWVRLLGAHVEVHARPDQAPRPVEGAVSARALAAVAILVPIGAEQLAEILWPDSEPQPARLRSTLFRLNERTGVALIRRAGGLLSLAPGVTTDLAAFESAAAAVPVGNPASDGAARAALAYYGGELLPTMLYEEWASVPRERVRRTYLGLLDLLAETAAARGEVTEAVARLEQAIAVDRYDEQRYLTAARLLSDLGWQSRASALCRRAVAAAASLGVACSPEITELQARLTR